jgi:hypothetical protein
MHICRDISNSIEMYKFTKPCTPAGFEPTLSGLEAYTVTTDLCVVLRLTEGKFCKFLYNFQKLDISCV